jgi:adenosylcobalamin-dependent ribonucleoside-triphosphate reductase
MARYVVRRDGTVVAFEASRITNAIRKALVAGDENPDVAESLSHKVVSRLFLKMEYHNLEEIQDIVELVLMAEYPQVAKRYIIYRNKHLELRKTIPKIPDDKIVTPWGPLGSFVFYRTYSRRLDEDDPNSRMETFDQAINRVLVACHTQLNCEFTREEIARLRTYMLRLKCLPAGRFLWQLGTKTVNKLGLASLQNCAFRAIDSIDAFPWMMDLAMLGVGIGFSVSKEHISKLPSIVNSPVTIVCDSQNPDFTVHDSREGWDSLVRQVLNSFFVTGKSFKYSVKFVREEGEPLKGFGGVASGPKPLLIAVEKITKLLNAHIGKAVTSVIAHHLACILFESVVAGNIRRVAAISIGDCDDIDYIQMKRYDLHPEVPPYLCNANNSLYCDDITELPQEYWDAVDTGSEIYGLFNRRLARETGRLIDGNKYPDPRVEGLNPCGEQGLESGETCCLAELFLPNFTSKEELFDATRLIYRVCKHSLRLSCHHKITEDVVHENMRMGIGVTGYLQATSEQRSWLGQNYEQLRDYDETYSRVIKFNRSIKLTTMKPSGTLSLMAGVTPGCHPALFKYYIRRVRLASNNPLVEECRKAGYHVEPEMKIRFLPDSASDNASNVEYDSRTAVVSFPCMTPDGTTIAKDMSAIEQLEVVKELQTNWSDNNISVTVYINKEDAPVLKEYLLKNYRDGFKTCSFNLIYGGVHLQMPYEEITKERYEDMISKCRVLDEMHLGDSTTLEVDIDTECDNGVCPIK